MGRVPTRCPPTNTGIGAMLTRRVSGPGRRLPFLTARAPSPGPRFGRGVPPDPDGEARGKIWLKEDIEPGALTRMMQSQPPADETGIIWTTWEDPDQD